MKDEIASKIYVNLSRCEKGHDSCTEYSSMLHDMVHGHMLYDTVDFVLYQKENIFHACSGGVGKTVYAEKR